MTTEIVGDICLYGIPEIGFGFLCSVKDHQGVKGDPEPRKGRIRTDAILLGCDLIYALRGSLDGRVRIFDAKGERMATVPLARPGYYGDMTWEPAPSLEIRLKEVVF